MPEPKSMMKATSEANNLAALSEAKDSYVSMMESVCGGDKPFINEHVLEVEHLRIKDHAMEIFSNRRYKSGDFRYLHSERNKCFSHRKMGGEEFSASYRERLEKEIEDSFANYRAHNDGKNLFKAANTPITLGALSMLLYVASQFLSLIGLTPFAQLLNLVLTLTIFLLGAWGYVRYTGRAPDLGDQVSFGIFT